MIRRALALLALLPVIGAAAPTAAVVGDSGDADRLFAEMAASGEVDLLERERIRDLLAEQKLAELNARDLRRRFPHVEYYVVVGKAQVLVFDAKAGIRIADFIRDPEMGDAWLSLPQKAILNRARSAQGARPTIQVGAIAVLDRGVPERFRPQMRRFQSRLDAALIEDERFLFLERRETGHIAAEREFSDTAFPLIPSEHLLRVAYTPGERASVVHCTVRVQDRKGKQTAKVAAEDVFQDPDRAVRTLKEGLAKLSATDAAPAGKAAAPVSPVEAAAPAENAAAPAAEGELVSYRIPEYQRALRLTPEKVTNSSYGASAHTVAREDAELYPGMEQSEPLMLPPDVVKRKQEAERFYRRYQEGHGRAKDDPALDSAIALDPDNLFYRLKHLDRTYSRCLRAWRNDPLSPEKWLEFRNELRAYLDRGPEAQLRVRCRLFQHHWELPRMRLPHFTNFNIEVRELVPDTATPAVRAQYRQLLTEVRNLLLATMVAEVKRPPVTEEGLRKRLYMINDMYSHLWSFDMAELQQRSVDGLRLQLSVLESVPENRDFTFMKRSDGNHFFHDLGRSATMSIVGRERYYPLIDTAAASHWAGVRALAEKWRLMQRLDTHPLPVDEATLAGEYRTYCRRLLKTMNEEDYARFAMPYFHVMDGFCGKIKKVTATSTPKDVKYLPDGRTLLIVDKFETLAISSERLHNVPDGVRFFMKIRDEVLGKPAGSLLSK